MSFNDAHQMEKNKNFARHLEILRGLRFRKKGDQDAQFIVLATEVAPRGGAYVTGICTGGLICQDTCNMANGQVFRFYLDEISLTLDAIDKLESRIAQEYHA